MKATVEYKGRQVSIDIPDAKLEELIAEKKSRTGYERAERDGRYYASNIYSKDGYSKEYDSISADDTAFAAAAYCTDERLARDNARADMLMRQLRRYAAEHGGISSLADWACGSYRPKYFIQLNYEALPVMFVDQRCTYRQPGPCTRRKIRPIWCFMTTSSA